MKEWHSWQPLLYEGRMSMRMGPIWRRRSQEINREKAVLVALPELCLRPHLEPASPRQWLYEPMIEHVAWPSLAWVSLTTMKSSLTEKAREVTAARSAQRQHIMIRGLNWVKASTEFSNMEAIRNQGKISFRAQVGWKPDSGGHVGDPPCTCIINHGS